MESGDSGLPFSITFLVSTALFGALLLAALVIAVVLMSVLGTGIAIGG